MVYQIHLEGDTTIEVENAEDLLNAEITINKKEILWIILRCRVMPTPPYPTRAIKASLGNP